MDAKTAKIILYVGGIIGLGIVALLVIGLGFKDLLMSDEGLKQHFNQVLICMIACLTGILAPVALVFLVWGLIKVLQNDDSPLPLIGNWNIIK